MKRLFYLLAAILGITACESGQEQQMAQGPNIILVITDDQGYGDLGIHGNPFIRTPVLDSLALRSTRIDPFYVCPVCAPTRSSLMTGRYHLRTGVYDTYNGGAMMATEEVTMAEVLAANGYHTAMVGKWHLGDSYPLRPMDQGFQYYLAHKGGGIGQPGDDFGNYIRPDSSYFDPYLWENGERVRRQGYCSDIFTDQAIEFIRVHQSDRASDPFFLYLSYNAPHTPLQLPENYWLEYQDMSYGSEDFQVSGRNVSDMNESDLDAARKVYGMVSNIDDNLGRIFHALEELGLEENTLLVFITDNGPQQRRYNAGLNERKGSVMEGGIRVPCMFYWKGKLEEGRIIDNPSAHIDMMPTLLDFAGISYEGAMDGISLYPALMGSQGQSDERTLFFVWERGFPQRYNNMAVRSGRYKLVGKYGHGVSPDSLRLYDLEQDPFELQDLSVDRPDLRLQLQDKLDSWHREMIRSPHLLDPPRMILGSKQEKTVVLGRNDWKGPKAMNWGSAEAYGYWDVRIEDPGPYEVRLVFKDPLPGPGTAKIRAGTHQYGIQVSNTENTVIRLHDVHFDTGDHMFEGWYQIGASVYGPTCIEIEKISR